ncbi:MAG TPA: alpha-glucosidase [Bacteroides sp.]|nr:alpha-glucosidase [Bacteroides sp.]
MKRIKKLLAIPAILLPVMLLLISCSQSEKVKVSISELNNYPVVRIGHPYGSDITFRPVSEQTGSIGVEVDGEVIWIAGKPERTVPEDGVAEYTWEQSGMKVMLQVTEKQDEIDFSLKLEISGDQKMPVKWFLNAAASDDEYFTGVFERVVDGPQNESWRKGIETAMNLRGERVEMQVKPTVSAYAPFYLSSANYGLFVKGTWPGLFDFCSEDRNTVQVVFEGPEMHFRIYLAPAPMQIVQRHALDAGPPFVPPKWAFGPWRWRDDHNNRASYFDGSPVHAPYNSEIVEDILMMHAYDIPCTAYWIDRPWGPGGFGFDDYEIDYERLPGFEHMLSWLNGKDIELMLWICPWVYGDMADVAKEKGYGLVSRNMRPWPGRDREEMVVMDFTNPEARRWWGENGPAKLARMGVKGFKLDRGDGERLVDSLHLTTHSGISYRENYNDYSRQFVKATYDAVQPLLGEDFVLFPRAQYTGSARYGAMWAGDTDNSAEGLRSALIAMQRCAVMGYPNWGSDAGGYPQRMDREVTMRWLGFACFSPVMEVGPTNNRGFWGMNYEPSYDHELLAVWRFYSKLRMSLVDYLHALSENAWETGTPVARPLFLEYPDQEASWNNWTTYKLGDDLLVSVIWETGKTRQEVYLPAGEQWIDLWNGQEYGGGQTIEVDAPLYMTPVFLRKGSDLALPGLSQLYQESVALASVKYRMSELEAAADW